MKKELRIYRTKEGHEPFTKWLESLKDRLGRANITNRLNRVVHGNHGDCEHVGDGVYELRIHYGPGYRVYFSQQRETLILLLLGGNKRNQARDIRKARQFWKEFREHHYD